MPQNFWKHTLIISIFVITFTYMLPNTYDNDPIIQVSKKSSDITLQDVEDAALSSQIFFQTRQGWKRVCNFLVIQDYLSYILGLFFLSLNRREKYPFPYIRCRV